MQSVDWDRVKSSDDPQVAYSLFHKEFTNLYSTSFPLRTIKLNYRNRKSWLTEDLKRNIKIKNDLYCKYSKRRTKQGELHYTQYRNKLTSILHKAEKQHYDNLFDANKNNIKKSWELISEIINKKKPQNIIPKFTDNDDDKSIADKFNRFFVNVGPSLASKIPPTDVDPLSYLNPRNPHSIF